jgi:hypothetical protein
MYAKIKSYITELVQRARRRDVKALAILALLALLPAAFAAAYTWGYLLKITGTVVKSEVVVKTVEINFDQLPSGDIAASTGVGDFFYPGKLGLVYSFNVTTTAPEALLMSFIPVFVFPEGVGIEYFKPGIAWAGLIILLPDDVYEKVSAPEAWSRALERLCSIWHMLEMTQKHKEGVEVYCTDVDGDNYTDLVVDIAQTVVQPGAGEAKFAEIIVPGNITKIARCPVEDGSGVCLVVPAVNFTYPFYLMGGQKYKVEVMPHVITRYVLDEESINIAIKLVGNPPAPVSS